MRRLLLAVNVVLVVVAAYLAVQLVHAWQTARHAAPTELSKATVAEAPPTAPPTTARPSAPAPGSIAERNLFSPSRTEVAPEPPRTAVGGPTTPPPPKPRLYGVVIRADGRAHAFLEDTQKRRVFAYSVGDAVGGSRVERIEVDRVVLSRSGETFEVLLRDPTKPKPTPLASPPGVPGAPSPATPGTAPGGAFPPARIPPGSIPPGNIPPGTPAPVVTGGGPPGQEVPVGPRIPIRTRRPPAPGVGASGLPAGTPPGPSTPVQPVVPSPPDEDDSP